MSNPKNLGEFEIIVLAALIRLGDQAYGARIGQEITARSGRQVTVGALYTTLSRLEKKGYVHGRIGEATPERGGRAKRYFSITPDGQAVLEQSIHVLGAMLKGISQWPKTI